MSRKVAVLRPEPGNARTVAALEARGLSVVALPLFEVGPVRWDAPDPAGFDALMLTSANAVRHAGAGLGTLAALPVFAVGEATAEAARAAELTVAGVGAADADALLALAGAAGVRRALHLAGRSRRMRERGIVARIVTVYASEPTEIAAGAIEQLRGGVALLHSPRAATRLATLVDAAGIDRAELSIAAISDAAAQAAGSGWAAIAVAPTPDDDALVALAAAHAIDPSRLPGNIGP